MALTQLRYAGVFEAVAIRRSGFPFCMALARFTHWSSLAATHTAPHRPPRSRPVLTGRSARCVPQVRFFLARPAATYFTFNATLHALRDYLAATLAVGRCPRTLPALRAAEAAERARPAR